MLQPEGNTRFVTQKFVLRLKSNVASE